MNVKGYKSCNYFNTIVKVTLQEIRLESFSTKIWKLYFSTTFSVIVSQIGSQFIFFKILINKPAMTLQHK